MWCDQLADDRWVRYPKIDPVRVDINPWPNTQQPISRTAEYTDNVTNSYPSLYDKRTLLGWLLFGLRNKIIIHMSAETSTSTIYSLHRRRVLARADGIIDIKVHARSCHTRHHLWWYSGLPLCRSLLHLVMWGVESGKASVAETASIGPCNAMRSWPGHRACSRRCPISCRGGDCCAWQRRR